MLHYLALTLVTLAGLCFCLAAIIRLRRLQSGHRSNGHGWIWPVWTGITFLTVGFVISLIEGQHERFRFGVMSSLAAIASLFFASRFLTLPSRGLLALPVGGMALLVAMSGLTETHRVAAQDPAIEPESMPFSLLVHIIIMCGHLAAMLFAGAVGGLYLVTSRKLKTSLDVALQLPSLSTLERLCEKSLIVATALLIGGLVTGGAAMLKTNSISLLSLPVLSAMLSMAVLVIILAARLTGKLNRSHLAIGSLFVLGLAALSIISVSAGHYVG